MCRAHQMRGASNDQLQLLVVRKPHLQKTMPAASHCSKHMEACQQAARRAASRMGIPQGSHPESSPPCHASRLQVRPCNTKGPQPHPCTERGV